MQYKHDNKVNISTYKVNIQQRHVIKKDYPYLEYIYMCTICPENKYLFKWGEKSEQFAIGYIFSSVTMNFFLMF